jgi:hypothetical protein
MCFCCEGTFISRPRPAPESFHYEQSFSKRRYSKASLKRQLLHDHPTMAIRSFRSRTRIRSLGTTQRYTAYSVGGYLSQRDLSWPVLAGENGEWRPSNGRNLACFPPSPLPKASIPQLPSNTQHTSPVRLFFFLHGRLFLSRLTGRKL